ncbi:MAG: 1-acyl-sn-glycerol-3-phosphate acyltransferase, partial [Gammaproteobacteria bacterium]|nr:1-acyl-sn-glycerol-3-phosphate acyltransferase [Gammaproteobacteria bacterium]
AYYQLPNGYHFSFDTGFVSQIVWRRYGQSALRVIRESPGAEFGHNLFYRRLGHITVLTIESDTADLDEAEFAERRRAAGAAFIEEGKALLDDGQNLIVCPEGQSQPVELSPARFHTGAFRLALAAGASIVPVALAGFHRRYKDGPLVAIIGEPIEVARRMGEAGFDTVREFADDLRERLALSVTAAQEMANDTAILSSPDD